MRSHLDSFSKELNSTGSNTSKQKLGNSFDDEDEELQTPNLLKMTSDNIQFGRPPHQIHQNHQKQKYNKGFHQRLFYAKSMNNNASFSMNQSAYGDQSTPSCLKISNQNTKERSNKSVMLQENSVQHQNESRDLDGSFNQYDSHQSRKQYAHHQMIQGSLKNNRASSFSQHSKRAAFKLSNLPTREQSNRSLNQQNQESSSSSKAAIGGGGYRKISFASKEQLDSTDELKNQFIFQFPPSDSKARNQSFVKQNSFTLDRAPTASTRPQTTNQGTRQYFRLGESKGFTQYNQQNAVQSGLNSSFMSDRNNNSVNLSSTTNNKMFPRSQKQSFSFVSQNKGKKKPNEIRNQYDLDKSFLTVFNQTQFSHGEGNSCSSRYLLQKQITSAAKNDRKSVTSNYSKRGSVVQNTEMLQHLSNISPNTTLLNISSPNQSILKKRASKHISPFPINSPKLSKYNGILDEINTERDDNYKKIEQSLKDIEEDNFRNIFPNLKELLSRAVDTNDLKLFTTISEFMADLSYEMNDINAATFLYDQFRQLSTYTKNQQKKAKSLLSLAKCARSIHCYSEAIILLKKALQFAWFSKENDIELEIYDEFGRNYYYQGNIQKAHYYHERMLFVFYKRFMNGEYEDDNSPTKQFSEENLSTFFRTIQFTFQDVTSLLLAYLKIPVYTIDEMPQYGNINQINYIDGKTPRVNVNYYNQMNFDKCVAKDLITKIIIEDEFYIQIQSPKFSVKEEQMELSTLAQKRLNKMMFRQSHIIYDTKTLGKIDLDSKMRDYSNPFKYKVSLEKKIEYLKKQKLDVNIDEKLEKVRQARSQQKDEDIRSRVYNNSLYKHPKHQKQTRKPITNNFKNMYKNFIIDYIEKKNDNLFDLNQ